MSRIYFHSINGEKEIWGAERALAGHYINQLALSILNVKENYSKLYSVLNPESYLINPRIGHEVDDMETAIRVNWGFGSPLFIIDNKPVNIWQVLLNTAMAIGSDQIRLLTRLHAQCEIYSYIKGKNREWFADIISGGLDAKIYREQSGWKELIEFLISDNKNTVVTSYSVCTCFPNPYILGYGGDNAWEDFARLNKKAQWEKCLKELYKSSEGLEISPENFYVRFGNEINAFELINKLYKRT